MEYRTFFRHPKTIAERRENEIIDEEDEYPIKGRVRKDLPSEYDDLYFSKVHDRSWKVKKKNDHQWGNSDTEY